MQRAQKRDAPTRNALPDALVARFTHDVARLIGAADAGRIGLAVSGGPDSLALLLLASAAFPDRVEAATVDHRLRAASADEAAFVGDICVARGVVHTTLALDPLPHGNVPATARAARYAALKQWADARDIIWIMTGHHADDQRETMIMRLNRGSGISGLCAVRAHQGRIVRPLLRWRQRELAKLVAEAGIVAVDDPANHDDRFDRARLRKSLHDVDWLDPLAMTLSAEALAQADDALDWSVDTLEAAHIGADAHGVVLACDSEAIPPELLRRLVLRCLRRVDPACDPRGVALTRLITTLQAGRTAMLGAVVARGGSDWHFSAAPPRRPTISQ